MIDYKKVGTPLSEDFDIPQFVVKDCRVCDVYMVAKGDLNASRLVADDLDLLGLVLSNWKEISVLCGHEFMENISNLNDEVVKAFTVLVYAVYNWCVKMSVELRKKERAGYLILSSGYVLSGNATVH